LQSSDQVKGLEDHLKNKNNEVAQMKEQINELEIALSAEQ